MAASPLRTDTDAPTRTVSLRALLAGEIVVSTTINVVLNFFVAWLFFPIGRAVALWGRHGLAVDSVPASFAPAVMMTFAISLIMRRRLRAGLRVATTAALPMRLPEALLPRAFAIGAVAILLVDLPTIAVLAAGWNDAWGWSQLVPFKLAFSVFHAVIVTPIVVLAELRNFRRGPHGR